MYLYISISISIYYYYIAYPLLSLVLFGTKTVTKLSHLVTKPFFL